MFSLCMEGYSADGFLIEERHYAAVRRALAELNEALAVCGKVPPDLLGVHLKAAWDALGEISGETANERIIDEIFQSSASANERRGFHGRRNAMVNLELYRVFYTVARCGSLTRAADELFISQPAVSQSIKQLEGQLGCSLFNRTHRGMELSEQGGKQIFDIVEKALGELDAAENKLKEINSTATGTIRISASDTIFSYVLIDKIARYHEKYPDVKPSLINCITTETLDLLKNNKCDIAFLNLPVDDKDFNLSSVVMPLHDTFVANERYKTLAESVQPLRSMHDYPLLMLDQNTVTRKAIINFSHSIGVHLHPEIECGSLELMIQLAKNGVGIACVPREYVRRELSDDKTLFEIRTEPALPARGVGIAFPKNQTPSFAVREFFRMFDEN